MDKPHSSTFPSSTNPTFVLQNIFATNANNLLQMKGYVPLVQVKDMGNALATLIRTCIGSGFDNTQEECTIQTDLLARIVAYAASELNTEVADYTVASHGSTILLIIYREIQEDWDFSRNLDNYLLSNMTKTIQDNLDKAFTNRQHKNIMSITTPISHFSPQDKHTIMDAITNKTPLLEKWAFTDEKGHKRITYGWLSGNDTPKRPIPPLTSFSLTIGQKCPLETDQEMENITCAEWLDTIRHHLPLPQSTIKANIDAWTITTNNCLDICRSTYPNINPMVLRSTVIETADKLGKKEYFVNKICCLTRSEDQKVIQDFEDEQLQYLLQEMVTHFSSNDNNSQSQDSIMENIAQEPSKVELICKTTAIWKDMAKMLWKENILTCNQETLDQATQLLLLEDTTHKYAQLSQGQIYDTEIDQHDQIIARITELNINANKAIADIQKKSIPAKDQNKINLITQQGWETAKCTILQNPSKFFPPNIPSNQQTCNE
ncbi:hypothetical protein AMATHDRAFT_9747 [Amanita thiersii Skay4041]|uniref:Uncharacterized protein n=1 Tax=Amanita thiersii Skay4041 TaxID=703135 RepID=A0A2A9N649_9AGAR|nr:hypothetical protein AMATHDRAFT_9747 [Amanita thiersii Skay4041]